MAAQIIRDEYVTIGGIVLATPAYRAKNFLDLYGDPLLVGDDVDLVGQDGVDPQARKNGPLLANMTVLIFGDKDSSGAAYGNARIGFKTNVSELKTITEAKSGDGTQTLILTFEDSSTVSADVIVEGGLQLTYQTPTQALGRLSLKLPDGALF